MVDKSALSHISSLTAQKLRIWSHLQKKYLMENFIFCAVPALLPEAFRNYPNPHMHSFIFHGT